MILCHHGVGSATIDEDPYYLRVSERRFRAQLELLLEAGFEFVTVAQLAEWANSAVPPPGYVALSFDDGMEDNHSVVLPILRDYGLPATVYVATGMLGKPNPFMSPESEARMMTAEQLRELAAEGIELGAHTVNHVDLSTMDRDSCLREMVESRDALAELAGVPVTTFAYPFCRYGDAARAAASDAGFTAAVTCSGRGSWHRFEMKRVLITGKDGPPSFLLKVAGRYEAVSDSAPGRLARVGTRAARRRVRRIVGRR